MKEKIKETITEISLSLVDGPIDDVIENISNIKNEYPNRQLFLDLVWSCSGASLYLYEVRDETDYEYKTRIEKEEVEHLRKLNQQKKKAENERKKYEELKKKYEKETNP